MSYLRRNCYSLLLFIAIFSSLAMPQWASANGLDSCAEFLSNGGIILYVAAGAAQPAFTDKQNGVTNSLRTVDALGASMLVTQALKMTIHETRPDGSSDDSFPSGHSTAAFSIATAASHFHPDQALYWYLGATLIAASRVQLDRHYTHDVITGAAIGYLTTRWALSHQHGVVLVPVIDASRKTNGLCAMTTF